jgi:hypothetical protein
MCDGFGGEDNFTQSLARDRGATLARVREMAAKNVEAVKSSGLSREEFAERECGRILALYQVRAIKFAATDTNAEESLDERAACFLRAAQISIDDLRNMKALWEFDDSDIDETSYNRFVIFTSTLAKIVKHDPDGFPKDHHAATEEWINAAIAALENAGCTDVGRGAVIWAIEGVNRGSMNALCRAFFVAPEDADATGADMTSSFLDGGW